MKELIRKSNNGAEVVSARELYESMGLEKSQWARWYKKNIVANPYVIENTDWQGFDTMSNGNTTKDFALTVDFAKRLAMMVRTKEGEAVRNYFLQCEKRAKQTVAATPLDLIQLMLDQAKAQEQRLSAVEIFVDTIKEERNKATEQLLLVERSNEQVPEETTRIKIRRIINQYCQAKNADYQSVWHVVYDRLYYRYGVNIRSIVRKKNESVLDVAERLGHLDKIYAICSSEFV